MSCLCVWQMFTLCRTSVSLWWSESLSNIYLICWREKLLKTHHVCGCWPIYCRCWYVSALFLDGHLKICIGWALFMRTCLCYSFAFLLAMNNMSVPLQLLASIILIYMSLNWSLLHMYIYLPDVHYNCVISCKPQDEYPFFHTIHLKWLNSKKHLISLILFILLISFIHSFNIIHFYNVIAFIHSFF